MKTLITVWRELWNENWKWIVGYALVVWITCGVLKVLYPLGVLVGG